MFIPGRRPHLLFLLLLLLCGIPYAAAQEEGVSAGEGDPPIAESGDAQLTVNDKDRVDAVLLLDASASMRITDPERLRDEGAKLLLQFLKVGDRLAVVEFAKEARVIRELTEYEPIKAKMFAEDIEKVGNSGLYTDIVAGIQKAAEILQKDKRKEARRVIILLSDGKFDPSPEKGDVKILTGGLLYQLLPELKQDEIVVHTLGFSEEADRDILEQISHATEGAHTYAETPQEIGESFTKLFLIVKKPQMVPLGSKGFKVDGDVREATFYINNEDNVEISLQSPSGSVYTPEELGLGMRWYRGQKFDVITLDEPEVGMWQVRGPSIQEGFATVLTELKLLTDWPSMVLAGEKKLLQARLYEEDRPVVLPEMSSVTKYAYQITPTDKISEPIVRKLLNDNGEDGDRHKDDGIFSSYVEIEKPGEYKLQLIARSPTFERTQTFPFRVKPRLVTLEVVQVEDLTKKDVATGSSATIDYFRVAVSSEAAGLKQINISLRAKSKSGKIYALPLKASTGQSLRYEVPVSALPEEGVYELQATLTGMKRKKEVHGSSEVLEYEKVTTELDESMPAVEVVVVEQEEEEGPPSPILWTLIVLVFNGALGGMTFLNMQKNQKKTSFDVPVYEPSEELVSILSSLEEKSALTDVDINDPMFTGSDVVTPPSTSPEPSGEAGEEDADQEEPQAADSEEKEEQEEEEEDEGDPEESQAGEEEEEDEEEKQE